MNQLEKFNETVGVLVKAYLNNELRKGACRACAVGNICAAALGVGIEDEWDTWGNGPHWQELFMTSSISHTQRLYCNEADFNWEREAAQIGLKQVQATGYTIEQLARIERAFELANTNPFMWEQSMFDGLMAVVDVLADIHGIPLDTAQASKALFVRA